MATAAETSAIQSAQPNARGWLRNHSVLHAHAIHRRTTLHCGDTPRRRVHGHWASTRRDLLW